MTHLWSGADSEIARDVAHALTALTTTQPHTVAWEKAWETAVASVLPYLLRQCERRLGDAAAAAPDVCQDVFLAVTRLPALAQIAQSPDAFIRYLSRAADNRCIDVLRKRARRREDSLDVLTDDMAVATTATAILDFDEPQLRSVGDLVQRLAQLGQALAPADESVLRAVVDGRPMGETAEHLGITKGALAVRLHRLRIRIRKLLPDMHLGAE